MPKNDIEAYKWLLIGRQATPLMAHIQKASWGFSSAEKKEGQKLAEEWLTKHGKKLTVTKLSLPKNNNNRVGREVLGLAIDLIFGFGLGK